MQKRTKIISSTNSSQSVVLDSPILRENLPLPFVHYPNHYGTFFTFSETPDGTQYFCSCNQVAIENYLELSKNMRIEYNDKLKMAPLPSAVFPNSIAEKSLSIDKSKLLLFKDRICHRCNLIPPTQQFCHPMYGGNFKQKFGWYINQSSYRIGVKFPDYVNNYTPEVFTVPIEQYRTLQRQRQELINEHNSGNFSWIIINNHDKKMSKLVRQIEKYLENITREEFGFRKVGEGNVSETILFKIVQKIYLNSNILRNHRPQWLNGLELDIFIPEKRIAYEYQGQQHYFPIEAWGGIAALKALKERDSLKKKICKLENITLIEIDYTEPLNEEYIKQKTRA